MPSKSKKLSLKPLHLQVREMLWREIMSGDFSSMELLPSEAELCDRYGVSRSTIRGAVTSLEQEGYLKRVHGKGTFIDYKVRSLQMRVDVKIEFTELLSMAGYSVETKLLNSREESATDEFIALYGMEDVGQLLMVEKLWLANGKPAIHCVDWIPLSFTLKPFHQKDLEKDIFSLMKKCCGFDVAYQIGKLVPRRAGEKFSVLFGVEPSETLISVAGAGYWYDGKPVVYGYETYNPTLCELTFLRTKI